MAGSFRYWRRLRRRRELETDLDDELRATLALLTAEKQRAGLAPNAAARAARLELGNLESLKEQVRDVVGVRLLHDFASDWRQAMRTLRRTPLVTSVAILSLALAVGANTAIFSIVNGLMLRTLPVRDPGGLVLLSDSRVASRVRAWDYLFWEQIHQRSALFGGTAAWSFIRLDLASGGESQFVEGMWASGALFDVLGVDPALGRTFGERDDQRGGGPDGPVAVISHGFWQRRFGGTSDVIGRVVRLNSVPFTIVGVTPPRFFGTEVGRTFDVILPLHTEPLVRGGDAAIDNPGTNFLTVIARLRSDQSVDGATATLRAAQPEVRAAAIARQADVPPQFIERYLSDAFLTLPAETGYSNLRLQYQRPMLVISAVVALVLLIACVNIANLLLACGLARQPEMQVRLAIGASRWRVARQLLTESLVLAAAGAALGVAMAPAVGRFLVSQLTTPANIVFLDTSLDIRVLAFTAALTVVTALLFGTAPAFSAARVSLMHTLKDRRPVSTPLSRGPAGWLVVVQVALTVVLVVAAGLFVRSFASLAAHDLGFEADRVLVVTIDSERAAIDPSQRRTLYERVRNAVLALPGVEHTAVSLRTPIATGGLTPPVAIDGAGAPVVEDEVFGNLLSPGWFQTYGIRLVAGRDITATDRAGALPVAIVNETFARRYLADGSLGRTFVLWPNTPRAMRLTVIGVAADAAYFSARTQVPPSWYIPVAQFDLPGFPLSPIRLSVRPKAGTPAQAQRQVGTAIATVDPRLAVTFSPLSEQVYSSLTRERMLAQLAGFFGALALLLAGIGLYGLTAYGISRRRAEIGIRLALGAAPSAIMGAVLGRTSRLVAGGLVAGMAASVWAAPILGGLIYGLQPRDMVTLLYAALVLCATAAVASWLPARRAVRLDPAAALRED